MKVLARIAFSWKVDDTDYSDPGSVVEALRRAGYTVRHMSHDYGTHGTDCVEAIIDACAGVIRGTAALAASIICLRVVATCSSSLFNVRYREEIWAAARHCQRQCPLHCSQPRRQRRPTVRDDASVALT